jgi:CubicO group peptidase (beta-lactamase class C family)
VTMAGIGDVLQPFVDSGAIPGAVAVVGRSRDLEVTAVGHLSLGGPPMREDSMFRIASAGKPITAAATLALVADGRIDLADPVAEVLPELASPRVLRDPAGPLDDTVPCQRPITVRDLLRSTSGHGQIAAFDAPVMVALSDGLHQGPPRPAEGPAADEWLARLAEIPLVRQPGEGFAYNTPYDVLGVFIERVTGRPFADHVAERILQPLGMADSGFRYPPEQAHRASSLYRPGDDGALELVDGPDGQWTREPTFASGAGGMVSTAADLAAFLRMLLDGGGGVLPGELVAAMTCDQLTPAIRATDSMFLDGQSWGYGGGIDIVRSDVWNVLGRYGWVGGTGTSAHVVPADGSIVVLLTQVELGGPDSADVLETTWSAAAHRLGHA